LGGQPDDGGPQHQGRDGDPGNGEDEAVFQEATNRLGVCFEAGIKEQQGQGEGLEPLHLRGMNIQDLDIDQQP